jgi:hypothetical protein
MRGAVIAGLFYCHENFCRANLVIVERRENAGPFDFAQGRLFDFILASQ